MPPTVGLQGLSAILLVLSEKAETSPAGKTPRQPPDLSQRMAAFQRRDVAGLGVQTAEGVHADDGRTHLRDEGQERVGQEPGVGPDPAEDAGQDQALQGAEGMVGGDQERAGSRDAGQVAGIHVDLDAEVVEHAVDESQGVAGGADLAVDGVQLGQAEEPVERRPDQVQEGAGQGFGCGQLETQEIVGGGDGHGILAHGGRERRFAWSPRVGVGFMTFCSPNVAEP